jgi:hypothetical protein
MKATQPIPWSLEVLRGREVGRVYGLPTGETIVGNALNGDPGLDLVDQEGVSPRRMAARHAAIALHGQQLTIRDLDTPGGTFVNRQRLLSGQERRLQPGDVIQLGGVQLRVEARAASPPPAPIAAPPMPAGTPPVPAAPLAPESSVSRAKAASSPPAGRLPVPFAMAGGPSCRTWDDFLVLAAQRWTDLRNELASGRLAEYLGRIQRPDLVPRLEKDRSLDEQLDHWLSRLPASRSSAPELDVHPEALNVRAVSGGGVTRHSLRITNVGYRLLRCTARVEPAGTGWIRFRPEHDGHPFFTIEQTDLPLEVEIPEVVDRPLSAAIVLESNGGTRRVLARIERPAEPVASLEPATGAGVIEVSDWSRRLGRSLARLRPVVRIAAGAFGALALRFLVVLSGLVLLGGQGTAIVEPRLSVLAVVLAGVGVVVGGSMGRRQGDRRDLLPSGFAGGLFGLLIAAVVHAAIRSVERTLGVGSSSVWAVGLLWAAIGAAVAGVSILWIPYRSDKVEAAP